MTAPPAHPAAAAWEPVRWTPGAATNVSLERAGHTATPWGRYIYMLGGRKGSHFYQDLLRLDTVTGECACVFGHLPFRARANHTATVVGTTAWFVGGSDNQTVLGDVHVLHLETLQWEAPDIRDPEGLLLRTAHATDVHPLDSRALLVFGGYGAPPAPCARLPSEAPAFDFLNDLVMLHTDTLEVRRVAVTGRVQPTPRGYHSFTTLGGKCYVFGGRTGSEDSSRTRLVDAAQCLAVFNPADSTWAVPCAATPAAGDGGGGAFDGGGGAPAVTGSPPAPRSSHRVVAVGDRLVLFGGAGASCDTRTRRMDDVHTLAVSARRLRWSACDSPGQEEPRPQGRSAHSMCLVQGHLYTLCGYMGSEGTERRYATDCYRLPLAPTYAEAQARCRPSTTANAGAAAAAAAELVAEQWADAPAVAATSPGVWHQRKRPRAAQGVAGGGGGGEGERRTPPSGARNRAVAVIAAAVGVGNSARKAGAPQVQRPCARAAPPALPAAAATPPDSALTSEMERLQRQLERAQADNTAERHEAARAADDAHGALQRALQDAAQERAMREDLERRMQAERAVAARQQADLDGLRAQLQGEVAAHQRQVADAERLQTRLSESQKRLEDAAVNLRAARAQLQQALGEREAHAARASDLEAELLRGRVELQAAERAHAAEVEARRAQHEAAAAQQQEALVRLRQSVEDQSRQIRELREAREEAARAAAAQAQDAARRAADVERRLEEARAQAGAQQHELAQLRVALQQASTDAQALQARNKVLEEQHAKAGEELARERAEGRALAARCDAAAQQLQRREEAQARLCAKMQALQDEARRELCPAAGLAGVGPS